MRARTFAGLTLAFASASLHAPAAAAESSPGVQPGDEALSCEQIQAQGMAEAQHDQQERSRRSDDMKARQAATMGLGRMAMLLGGLGGTAQSAQKAAEGSADRAVAMLGTAPQVNPRLERLKELSARKHCTVHAAVGAGAAPSDDALSCEQIAAELSGHAQRLKPSVQALAQSQQELYKQEREMGEKRRADNQVLGAAWAGASLDPTGIAKRAAQAATVAQHAKERRENERFAHSPQFRQATAQGDQLAEQGAQMQADARLQHLLQLGQSKGCDKTGAGASR
ncbi:MAG TPA: hypothetical protein VJ743_07100 [Albitalea sp.]|nr:hypothetical protein [Albitalea sp.]